MKTATLRKLRHDFGSVFAWVEQGEPVGISKRGNVYLRTLLIHGGRALVQLARTRTDRAATWLGRLVTRRHHNVAAVAMANKNARLAWALLASGKAYDPGHAATPKA